MGKRTKHGKFKRVDRDFYRTVDIRAGNALAPHLAADTQFIEPCAGAFDLAAQLIAHGHICMAATDLAPQSPGISQADAFLLQPQPHLIITNPPWRRDLLHALILHFIAVAPACWLLFDADWLHTDQAIPFMVHCTDYVPVGRLLWIPGTTTRAKDNASWYRFEANRGGRPAALLHPKVLPCRK